MVQNTYTSLVNYFDSIKDTMSALWVRFIFWIRTQMQSATPRVRAARPYVKRCVRGFGRLVKLYLMWVVAYTVMEHFAPGLAGEILANLGKVWNAIVDPLASRSNFFEEVFYDVFMFYEYIWNWIAGVLPFLAA